MEWIFNLDAMAGKIAAGSGLTLGVIWVVAKAVIKALAKRTETTLDDEVIQAVEDATNK